MMDDEQTVRVSEEKVGAILDLFKRAGCPELGDTVSVAQAVKLWDALAQPPEGAIPCILCHQGWVMGG